MAKVRKEDTQENETINETKDQINISDIGWTDFVLSHLSEDEKISGNPTTDGLRRIFETVMKCKLVQSTTSVIQAPSPENEKRATVIHRLVYRLNSWSADTDGINTLTVDGSADVYWGNCDKVYRNHPVAVAETRAEGRSLRRALKLRKVVAAEELAENIEDDISNNSVNKISSNQLNFLDVMAKRLNISVVALSNKLSLDGKNIKKLLHDDGVKLIRELSRYQQDIDSIPEDIKPYESNWN